MTIRVDTMTLGMEDFDMPCKRNAQKMRHCLQSTSISLSRILVLFIPMWSNEKTIKHFKATVYVCCLQVILDWLGSTTRHAQWIQQNENRKKTTLCRWYSTWKASIDCYYDYRLAAVSFIIIINLPYDLQLAAVFRFYAYFLRVENSLRIDLHNESWPTYQFPSIQCLQ